MVKKVLCLYWKCREMLRAQKEMLINYLEGKEFIFVTLAKFGEEGA